MSHNFRGVECRGTLKEKFPYSRGNCYNSWPRVVDKENSILGMDDKN